MFSVGVFLTEIFYEIILQTYNDMQKHINGVIVGVGW